MSFDDLNIQILKHIREGRQSFDEIGNKLSVTPNTVRARVRKLISDGVLDIVGLVDPEKIENHFFAFVGVKLKVMNLMKKGEEFRKLRGVISVGVVTGRFDLIVGILLNKDFGLLEFFTTEVSKISGVLSTETFMVYKNYGWKVPYVL